MRTLRARLIMSHVLPLLVVIPLVGIALTYLFETQVLIADLSRELELQATLVASLATSYPQIWSDPTTSSEFVARIGEQLTAHLSLYTTDGTLLASTDPAEQKSLGQRGDVPGLAQVLATGAIVVTGDGQQRGSGTAQVLVPVYAGHHIVGVIRVTDPLSNVYARFPRTRLFIILVLAGGLVIGTVVGWFLAIDLERPLRRVTWAIAAVADGKPLEALPEQGPQEVRLLLRAFNSLAAQLQSLEKARRRLLANLVHELGRPLGALLSAIQALSRGADADPDMRRELLAGMEAETHRTERLLEDLTRLYDLSLGPLEMDLKPTSLLLWLTQVLAPWREEAQTKGLRWQVDLPAELPSMDIDPDRMAQALGNVVSNAIKYTPPGGKVGISAGADEQGIWIQVQDSGPGIAPEEQQRIFVPHYRGPSSRRFPQGMGLGLSIARDLIAAHSGRIELRSALGLGSTFTIRLPKRPPQSEERAV